MREHQAGQERLLKQLISTFRCQYCRRAFEREQVRVTARHEQLWIVSVRCGLCRNQQVFWVALKDAEGAEDVDVAEVEEERFAQMPALSGDDILDMHEFLDGFSGDFRGLFDGDRRS